MRACTACAAPGQKEEAQKESAGRQLGSRHVDSGEEFYSGSDVRVPVQQRVCKHSWANESAMRLQLPNKRERGKEGKGLVLRGRAGRFYCGPA